MSVSLSPGCPWTKVIQKILEDSRNLSDPLPLQDFTLEPAASARYLMFDLLSFYGHGGGLQFFEAVTEAPPQGENDASTAACM